MVKQGHRLRSQRYAAGKEDVRFNVEDACELDTVGQCPASIGADHQTARPRSEPDGFGDAGECPPLRDGSGQIAFDFRVEKVQGMVCGIVDRDLKANVAQWSVALVVETHAESTAGRDRGTAVRVFDTESCHTHA